MKWVRASSVRPHKAAAQRRVLHRGPESDRDWLVRMTARAYGVPPQIVGRGHGWGERKT